MYNDLQSNACMNGRKCIYRNANEILCLMHKSQYILLLPAHSRTANAISG